MVRYILLLWGLFTLGVVNSTKGPSDLTIGGEPYSVLERPSVNSQLVEEAQADVTITIDLHDIPGDLLLVAKFLQVAENGLVSFPVIQATFWDEMSGHLKDLQSEEQLKNVLSIEDEKEREEIIRSYVFKKALLKNFAKWIATHQMTKVFRQRMKPVRDELANIVRGNLDQEESRKNMKKISGELFAEEARRRKRIKAMKRNEPRDEL
uniref:Uncharacterized protein n=1 Tax=Amphimedon queenslandica TaxID=400682 RepID=A0A1X7TMM7_AMPQE